MRIVWDSFPLPKWFSSIFQAYEIFSWNISYCEAKGCIHAHGLIQPVCTKGTTKNTSVVLVLKWVLPPNLLGITTTKDKNTYQTTSLGWDRMGGYLFSLFRCNILAVTLLTISWPMLPYFFVEVKSLVISQLTYDRNQEPFCSLNPHICLPPMRNFHAMPILSWLFQSIKSF